MDDGFDQNSDEDSTVEVQSLLASIVEYSEDAIISKTLQGIVTSWNRAAERLFGYTAEEMIGHSVFVLAAPDRVDEMPAILARIRRGERVEHYETLRKAKNGQLVEVSLTVSPILDRGGRIVGASKIARDISDKRRAEKALALHAEKLARSNEDLQQFAYVASHDLQEPLRSISAFSELLRRRYKGRLDEDADGFLDSILAASIRMNAMIRGLLEYARTGGRDDVPMSLVDLKVLVQGALQNLEQALIASGGMVTVEDLPVVRGDEAALLLLLQNLIGNAIKYQKPEVPPLVNISAKRDGAFWQIDVSDNGIGIDQQYADRIFGLFKRLHGNRYPGTGIGLTLCRRIVERHGGRIWMESQLGEGARFSFTLPVD